MPRYLIEIRHLRGECRATLDDTLALGKDVLARYHFACSNDVHTGWAIVEAESKEGARAFVPPRLAGRAWVIEVRSHTPEEVRDMHAEPADRQPVA